MSVPAPSLTAVFSASFLGGSELFNLEYLRDARERGAEIDAVVPARGELADALEPLARSISVVPIPEELTELSRFDQRIRPATVARAGRGAVSYARRLRSALAAGGGPLCCFGFRAQLAAAYLTPVRARPRVWVVHEVVPDGAFATLWARASRGARLVLGYSRTALAQRALRSAPTRLIEPRLDLSHFTAVADPATPPRTLGLIGDLFPIKNHLGFVEVVRRLREHGEQVDGLMVGRKGGEIEQAHIEQVTAAAEREGIPLVSARPEEIPAMLGRMDLLTHLTTVPETFGRVCVEAMAAGRPVVAFGHGAVADVVGDGESGLLCPPDDLGAVVDGIRRLRSDRDLFARLSANARTAATERFAITEGDLPTIGAELARISSDYVSGRSGA
jgi:glycosyltransferase involved in cell wall biosynthesis